MSDKWIYFKIVTHSNIRKVAKVIPISYSTYYQLCENPNSRIVNMNSLGYYQFNSPKDHWVRAINKWIKMKRYISKLT